RAGTTTPPGTVIAGGGATGVLVANGVQGAQISGMEITGFSQDCILANQGNHGLTVTETFVHGCGRHGIYVNGVGGINDIEIINNEVTDVGNRGIVVWNGAKSDIVISGNWVHGVVDLGAGPVGGAVSSTGIAFEDGTASGVTVFDNLVENINDAGIVALQLTSGGSIGNTVAFNTVRNTGRFGIVLMLPNGTGLDAGIGSIVVEGNTVSGGAHPGGYASDRAGISVIRRYLGLPHHN